MQITLFIAALLALGVIVLLLPLASRKAAIAEIDDADFFRARLQEIERDLARGVIEAKEAEDAKIEASRALLNAEARKVDGEVQASLFRRRSAAVAAIVIIPAISLGLYYQYGSPLLYDVPLASRVAEMNDNNNFAAMIAQVEKRLEEKPDDGLGWVTIAPVYADLGRYEDAIRAFENAIRYQGDSAELRSGLGEARLAAADGVVTAEARSDFDKAIALDPKNLRALYYRAVALQQDGKKDEAIAAFRSLLTMVESAGDASSLVKSRLAELEGETIKKDFAADADQAAMIRSMVERLDQRLTSDGSDVEGWARLMRAYQVMGENDKAKTALERARKALEGNADALQTVEKSAADLGLK